MLLQHGGGKAGVREDQRHLPPLKSPDSTVNRRHHLLRLSHRTTISVFLEFEAAGGQADVLAFALTTKWPARHLQKIRPNRVSRSGCPYSKPAFSKVPPEPPSKVGGALQGIVEMQVTHVTRFPLASQGLSNFRLPKYGNSASVSR